MKDMKIMKKYAIRTLKHINRVQKWGLVLLESYSEQIIMSENLVKELATNLAKHDFSKFTEKQFMPYAVYFGAAVKSEQIKDDFSNAWYDHYVTENHHPNGFKHGRCDCPLVAIEIACDLQAMAEEFGEGSCRKYYEEKWKKENSQYMANKLEWNRMCNMIERCIDCFEDHLKKSE